MRSDEAGSAVVEFTLVTILLVTLFLGIVQVGIALHVRNTLVACAAEGARYGANADRTPADAQERTRDLIRSSLADRFAGDVSAEAGVRGGVQVVTVRVVAGLPILGLAAPVGSVAVEGNAVREFR